MKRCGNCFELLEDDYNACPYCGYMPGNPPKELFHLFPGSLIAGRYYIGEVLGFGGFGITYKAWDKKLETIVTIKEYYPASIVSRRPGNKKIDIYARKREAEFLFGKERFLEEARSMAKFSSEPNIINIFEYFEENDTAYIVMEFLNGISLKTYFYDNGAKLDLKTALGIINPICDALTTIHEKGIIHRDISPDNIFLCKNGAVKLIDFGAARFTRDENRKMTIILKPGFAPPEQYESVNKQGPWTDVYALGATLYCLLTGYKPTESTNRKIRDELSYPHMLDPSIPEYISCAIMKAMAIDPNLRFKSVDQFKSALAHKMTVKPVSVERKKKKRRRNISLAASLAVVAAAGAFSGYKLYSEKNEETLSDTSISIWYCKSGDGALDEAEENGYNSLKDAFTEGYPNVQITITGFDKSEYADAVKNASEGEPDLIEWDESLADCDPEELGLLSLEDVYSSEEAAQCSLLRAAPDLYGGYYCVPLGFDAPAAFFNGVMGEVPDGMISSLDGYKTAGSNEEMCFVSDYDGMPKMFDGADLYYAGNACEIFKSGKAFCCGTLTANYADLRDAMKGKMSLRAFDCEKIYCRYSNVFAAKSGSEEENKAAERFIQFILSGNGQDILHLQNSSSHMPINDTTLDVFVSVNFEFDSFFDNKDKYVFEK